MADRKNGTEEGIHNALGEEPGPGFSSPVDCWELVSSPLPEAIIDGSAPEAAMAVGCSPANSLHDDYFACPHNLFEQNVLPLSTRMADQQSEHDRSDVFVCLCSEAESIANRDECNEDIRPMSGSSNVHYNEFILPDEDMRVDGSKCHDNNPFCMLLDEDVASHDANPVMCDREMMAHDDILAAGYDMDNDDSTRPEEDSIEAHTSTTVVEFTATSSNGHQLSTLAATEDSELSSTPHGLQDNLMEIHPTRTEGVNSPTALGVVSREYMGHVEDSPNLRGSLAGTRNSKAFTCASWLWAQFCRWQAQFGYANTIWSMTLAATMMGIIVLGRGWQHLQAQNYSLRSQLWAKEKRITQLMFQLLQTKEALAKTRRVPVICVKPALQIPQG